MGKLIRTTPNINVYIGGDNKGNIVIGNNGNTLIMTNVHDISSIAAQAADPFGGSLSKQERDLLQIFRNSSGKKQIEIMMFVYGMNE